MPTPDPIVTPHGSTVAFAGVDLGKFLGFSEDCSAGQVYDATGRGCVTRGAGTNVRVQRQISVTMIDPGTVAFRALGNGPYGKADIGKKGTLAFTIGGVATSATAFLVGVHREGERNGLIQHFYEFQWEGT